MQVVDKILQYFKSSLEKWLLFRIAYNHIEKGNPMQLYSDNNSAISIAYNPL